MKSIHLAIRTIILNQRSVEEEFQFGKRCSTCTCSVFCLNVDFERRRKKEFNSKNMLS